MVPYYYLPVGMALCIMRILYLCVNDAVRSFNTKRSLNRDVVKFWKLVAHPGQWLTNVGGPDQI